MKEMLESHLNDAQRELMRGLDTPHKIQAFLDTTAYSPEYANRCPLRVMATGRRTAWMGPCLARRRCGASAALRCWWICSPTPAWMTTMCWRFSSAAGAGGRWPSRTLSGCASASRSIQPARAGDVVLRAVLQCERYQDPAHLHPPARPGSASTAWAGSGQMLAQMRSKRHCSRAAAFR
jgi:hypothetical protein